MGLLDPVFPKNKYSQKLRTNIRALTTLPAATATATFGTNIAVGTNLVTGTNGSVLTSPQAHPYFIGGQYSNGINTNKFTSYGWQLGDSSPGDSLARHYGAPQHPGGFTGGARPYSVEFMYQGNSFDIKYQGASGAGIVRLYIDGVPTSYYATTLTISNGGAGIIPVTGLDDTAIHRYRLEMHGFMYFGGLNINLLDVLVAAGRVNSGGNMLIIHDSYGDGASNVTGLDTHAHQLGRYMGTNTCIDAMGGTGFVATGGGGAKNKYLERVTAIANSTAPVYEFDVICTFGSTNDFTNNSVIPTEVPLVAAIIRNRWPNAKWIGSSAFYTRQQAATGMVAANANYNSALAPLVDLYINPIDEAWYTGSGSGNISTPNGTGNADRLMSADNLHPAQAGHNFIAFNNSRRLTNYFATLG